MPAVTVQWNKIVLEAIKMTKTSPPLAARALAMVHTAMYDAWSIYDRHAISTCSAKWIKHFDHCEESDIRQAISFAAYRVCNYLFWPALPDDRKSIFTELMHDLNYEPGDSTINTKTAIGLGNLVAQLTIGYRKGDGANQEGMPYYSLPWNDYTKYKAVNPPYPDRIQNINHWQPLRGTDGKAQIFLAAQWPLVKPFALKTAKQFRPQPPYNDYESLREFRKQMEEIYDISQSLTQLQKAIAEYWADGAGTVTPPGHWCDIAQYVAEVKCSHYTETDCIKLFFALTNAQLDASIAAWDAKRKYSSVRPITLIRELMHKKSWTSYIPTPPFPEHVSGHSTFSRASATILRNFIGSDDFGAAGVIEKGTSTIEPGGPSEDIQLPVWKTFTDAALEAGESRLYGGIHFRRGNEDGQILGEAVAECVWKKAKFYFNDKS